MLGLVGTRYNGNFPNAQAKLREMYNYFTLIEEEKNREMYDYFTLIEEEKNKNLYSSYETAKNTGLDKSHFKALFQSITRQSKILIG